MVNYAGKGPQVQVVLGSPFLRFLQLGMGLRIFFFTMWKWWSNGELLLCSMICSQKVEHLKKPKILISLVEAQGKKSAQSQ
jgi:hypothetical protein